MSVCYEQAGDDVCAMAAAVMADYHPELRMPDKSWVRLCVLFAFRGGDDEDGEPAVKLHGYPCAAVVSVIPLKQRVDKRADAEIVIDRERWDDMTDAQRRALLDHEIEHIELQVDENGLLKTDDVGRPKLRLKLHDWQRGGFRAVARRHGADAPEVVAARHFAEDFGNDVLRPAAEPTAEPAEADREEVLP
jgi:hypothetical protein